MRFETKTRARGLFHTPLDYQQTHTHTHTHTTSQTSQK